MNNLINKIIHADCMDILRALPDKCVDLVLTDPPYGIGADKGSAGFGVSPEKKYKGGWDSCRPDKSVFSELLRVSEKLIIFGGNYFSDLLPASRGWIVWDKKGDIQFDNPFSDVELAWCRGIPHSRKVTVIQQGFIASDKSDRIHPTQKPVALWEWCMREFSAPGDLVLDPFSGSGTTAIAGHRLGRRFICIEKDADYYAASVERLHRERQQLQLPGLLAGPEPQQGNLWERRGN